MRAAQIARLDGPDGIVVIELPEPVPRADEVLIDVEAAGVTFPELLMARGQYQRRPELPFVPGSQVAGFVRAAPAGSGLAPGTRVAALCGLGGFAEVAVAGVGSVFPLPERLSFPAGAVLPVNYLTMELAYGRRGQLRAGESVLVHGAAGGVGSAAVQMARVLGARVIAVTSSEVKADIARRLGADDVVPAAGFLDAVRDLTDGSGVDVVADPVGGDRFTDSLRALKVEGRLLVLGFAGGEIPTVKVNRLLLTNTSVIGVAWGEYTARHPGFVQEQWARLLPHIENGAIDPLVGGVYPLADAAGALSELAERRATGTLALDMRR